LQNTKILHFFISALFTVLCTTASSFAQVEDAKPVAEVFILAIDSDDVDVMKRVVESTDEKILEKVLEPNYFMELSGLPARGTPLQFAAHNGKKEGVKFLLEYVAAKPERAALVLAGHPHGFSVLHLAIKAGKREIAKLIIDFALTHDFAFEAVKAKYGVASALLYFAQRGDAELVQRLLELAKNPEYTKNLLAPDVNDFNALYYATYYGYPDLIRVLLTSPFHKEFLKNPKLKGLGELRKNKRESTWMALIEFAPDLAMNPPHKSLEGLGQCEAAFLLRNATLLSQCESLHINLNLTLLFAMFSHVEKVDERAYLDFIWEMNPVFYLVAVPALRLYEWIFIK
jgi:hypothetical protein